MKNELAIKLGDYEIVAEIDNRNGPTIPPELVVYLRDANGCITQDICLVRPHYEFVERKRDFEIDNGFVDCMVWSDSDDSDYFEKHVIAVYEEEE